MIRFQLRSITAILFILLTLFGITNTFLTPSLIPSPLSNTISYPIGNAFGMDHVGTDEAARAAQNGIHIARGDTYWNGAEQSLGVVNVSNIQPYIQAIENESISQISRWTTEIRICMARIMQAVARRRSPNG